jgi:hypothetical protein
MLKGWNKRSFALLYFNSFDNKPGGRRAWKGFPWSVMDQLHERITFPIQQQKISPCSYQKKGAKLTEEFEKLFAAK